MLPKPWAGEEGRVAGPAKSGICSNRLRRRCGLYHSLCAFGSALWENKPHQSCRSLQGLVPATYTAER